MSLCWAHAGWGATGRVSMGRCLWQPRRSRRWLRSASTHTLRPPASANALQTHVCGGACACAACAGGRRSDLMRFDTSFPLSLSQFGPPSLHGVSNYYLPILPHATSSAAADAPVRFVFLRRHARHMTQYTHDTRYGTHDDTHDTRRLHVLLLQFALLVRHWRWASAGGRGQGAGGLVPQPFGLPATATGPDQAPGARAGVLPHPARALRRHLLAHRQGLFVSYRPPHLVHSTLHYER